LLVFMSVLILLLFVLISNLYAAVPGLFLLTGTIMAGTAPLGHTVWTETGLPAQKEKSQLAMHNITNDVRQCGNQIHTRIQLGQLIGTVTHSMC
jgi:hypothetical protein